MKMNITHRFHWVGTAVPAVCGRHGVPSLPLAVLLMLVFLLAGGCATTNPPAPDEQYRDPVLVQLDSSARAAFAEGNYARAARFYELALGRARTADFGAEIAKAAYNRGACLILLKQPEPARAVLREAGGEFARQHEDASSAWLLEARAELMMSNRVAATLLVDRVLSSGEDRDVQLQAWLLKGEMALQESQTDLARLALGKARALLHKEPALQAGVSSLAGKVALADGKPVDAALNFDKQAVFLQRAARWADMAYALQQAGEAYGQAFQADAATLRFYRAARSYYAQGMLVPALQAVELAVQSSSKTTDEVLAADTGRLLEEIKRQVGVAQTAVGAE